MEKQWILNRAECVGRSHLPNNIPCQDKTIFKTKNGVSVIVLSDGCGSSKLSHFGAEMTVEVVSEILCEKFEEYFNAEESLEVKKELLEKIVKTLEDYAEENKCELHDLNATVLFVATKEDAVILGRLGDGYIGAVKDGKLSIVSSELKTDEKNGTYYPTLIRKFKHPDVIYAQFEIKKTRSNDFTGFILMSDGSGDSMVDCSVPFIRKFAPVIPKMFSIMVNCTPEETYQQFENFLANSVTKKTDDDCSFALMCTSDVVVNSIESLELPRPVEEEKAVIEEEATEPKEEVKELEREITSSSTPQEEDGEIKQVDENGEAKNLSNALIFTDPRLEAIYNLLEEDEWLESQQIVDKGQLALVPKEIKMILNQLIELNKVEKTIIQNDDEEIIQYRKINTENPKD